MTSSSTPPLITSIDQAAAGKDAWLVDIWGVMHNGIQPFAAAVAACEQFRAKGGTVLLLSNAPRPAPQVIAQLDRIGVSRAAYDAVLTSGDAARALVAKQAPGPVWHLGPERDMALYYGLGVALTGEDLARVVVCTGLFDDETETAETYRTHLIHCRERDVPMICANPDLQVERGGRIIPCAGAVAQLYETLGGRVDYAGKPFAPVYEMALQELAKLRGADVSKDRVLAIGDGIKTDIAGAMGFGIDAVYIASAIHAGTGALTSEKLDTLFPPATPRPIAAMSALA